jgi:hypothetical protein
MGYDDHKARLLGYPRRKSVTGQVMDFAVTLLIQLAALCVDFDPWLSSGTGGEGTGETNPAGLVVAWGSGAVVSNCPEDLYAVKVVLFTNAVAVALKSDGTLHVFGNEATISAYFSGWDALGDIIDIAMSQRGLVYLTSFGVVGVLGTSGNLDTNVPSVVDGEFIIATQGQVGKDRACVFRVEGAYSEWGYNYGSSYTYFSGTISNPKHLSAGYKTLSAVDEDGNLFISGADAIISAAPTSGVALCAASEDVGVAYMENGTFAIWGSAAGNLNSVPSGLVPVDLICSKGTSAQYSMMAIHQDGTPVLWGASAVESSFDSDLPAGLKVHQLEYYASPSVFQCAVAIQMAD